MQFKLIKTFIAAITIPATIAACGPTEEPPTQQVDCGAAKTIELDKKTFCVATSAITEEGFECPTGTSGARRYADLVVCAEGGAEIPGEIFGKLAEQFGETPLPSGECEDVLCDLDKQCQAGTCVSPDDPVTACSQAECDPAPGAAEDPDCDNPDAPKSITCERAANGTCSWDIEYCPTEEDETACLAACGEGCPAPEFQTCASDGNTYCNDCVIECKGLTVADDPTSCADDTEEACIEACGVGCPAPEFQPCASDGELYCNECIIGCKGLTVEEDASTCEAPDTPCTEEECGPLTGLPEDPTCMTEGAIKSKSCGRNDEGMCEWSFVQCSEEECITACGDGCPAPEFQICASDGELYCNDCIIECKGLTAEDDQTSCTE